MAMIINLWGRVRWKMTAIVVVTGSSTVLIACLAVAAMNVVVRRESANIVEKQIEVLVRTSSSVPPAILDHAAGCINSEALLDYTDEAFPQSRTSLKVGAEDLPQWLPQAGFTGLIVDRGQIEIRSVLAKQMRACKITAIFSMPLGSELSRRLSTDERTVNIITPVRFRVHPANQRILQTLEGNFVPGVSRPTSVVVTVRNWQTGASEDWLAYSVHASSSGALKDVARIGRQQANWVWLLTALCGAVVLLEAFGIWLCVHFGNQIAATIDKLSTSARVIASGNFGWRMTAAPAGQLGDLVSDFNQMAIALEKLKKEEAVKQRLESELQVARVVQESLFPKTEPVLQGVTISGRTMPARVIGGDLYDYFDLGQQRVGILCADISGKGIPAALMMANLQAMARLIIDGSSLPPDRFVESLNQQLAGRFGDNRYATLFWAEYDPATSRLVYVNAGNPAPILVHADGTMERLNSSGFPVGMFTKGQFTATTVQMHPGSRLMIFSDGVTDALNVAGDDFGEERLIARCQTIPDGLDAAAMSELVIQAVAAWSIETEQYDDTTIVVMAVASGVHEGLRLDSSVNPASKPNAASAV